MSVSKFSLMVATDINMTPSNLETIFGPDVEDPIDSENDPEDVEAVVGVHNNLVVEQSQMVMVSGCERYEAEARSYQDKMFVTLSFSDPELSASHFTSPQSKRVQSAPRLQVLVESQSAIRSKIENCLSTRSRSEDNLGSFHCQTGCVSEMSEQSSYFQNDETNLSDFTSVFTNETNETEPDLPTLLPGQIQIEEEEEDLQEEETTGAFVNEKTGNVHTNYKTRKRTWWKEICLLCMSKQ